MNFEMRRNGRKKKKILYLCSLSYLLHVKHKTVQSTPSIVYFLIFKLLISRKYAFVFIGVFVFLIYYENYNNKLKEIKDKTKQGETISVKLKMSNTCVSSNIFNASSILKQVFFSSLVRVLA